MGRDRALGAEPLVGGEAVRAALDETSEARRALSSVGPPPIDAVPDVRPLLERCRMEGAVLDGLDLASLIPLLDTGPRLVAYGRGLGPVAPSLADAARSLPAVGDLRDRLRASLEDDGTLTDAASPRLRALRREVRERRQRIVRELERMLGTSDAFAERFVTVRHGRHVLPVRAEARARVRGIVHDRSQSGQTLFVEPESLVEAGNDLVERQREEEQETARILAELSAAVGARAPELDALSDGIGALDWIFARARVADRMDATPPRPGPDREVQVRGGRHPLLLAQTWTDPARTVVPVDLELGPDRPLLVVTGPNAGGKTIALKTLGLLVLMAQVGCHVPAVEARLPVLAQVHTVVGDDQSVAENLSTFSAFVKQVKTILAEADERSLVLLDELGAGTDPDEGAALAQAILEELDAAGALVMATTHLEPLKAFASTHPRARNASVEFDVATLSPTFRLRYDHPGQSYALAIAARLGLSPDLIARAHAHRSEHGARLGELLERLDAHERTEAERARAIARREDEAEARLAAAREAEAEAARKARATLDRARAEAEGLLREIRRAVSAEWERLRQAGRSRQAVEESRQRVRSATARVASIAPPPEPPPAEPLAPGAAVRAEHLGLAGELVAISGATATVRAGALTVHVPVQALRRAEAPATTVPGVPRRGRPAGITVPDRAHVDAELKLIGRTTDEARDLVEQYLDDAFLAGLSSVRLIHGKGTGALRRAVRDLLEGHPLVASFRDGESSEGGAGATVAALKVS
jgi:DNA mismatch repair protein MutS2